MKNANTDTDTNTVHPFERAGLGTAPFRLVRVEGVDARAAQNAMLANSGLVYTTNLCGGSCDYCGTAIFDVYVIRSSDGREFKVGSDCVVKTASKRSARLDPVVEAVKRAKRELDRTKRHSRSSRTIATLTTTVTASEHTLRALPHSRDWAAAQGQTAWDELQWMLSHAGMSGRIRALQAAIKRLG